MEYTVQDEYGNLVPVRSSVPPRMQPRPEPPRGDRVIEDATPPRMQPRPAPPRGDRIVEDATPPRMQPRRTADTVMDDQIPQQLTAPLNASEEVLERISQMQGGSPVGIDPARVPDFVVNGQSDINKITKAASDIDKDEVDNNLNPEDDSKVQGIASNIVSRIDGGESPAEAIRKESSLLGDLFGNKNIQRALVYYLGARLMGYSGSGSGMAAGKVLLAGMEDSAKAEKLRLKSEAEAAAKNAIDMSKVVTMVDHKGNFVESYVSPNGKFFRPVNAPEDVAYRVSTTGYRLAKTGEEDRDARINNISQNVRNNMRPAIIESLKTRVKSDARPEGFEQQNIDIANQIFSEAGISDQLIQNIIDTYGLEYLETKGQIPLRNAMEQFAREVASGETVNIASAQGIFDRMMMKAAKVNLPREIYMLDGNMASSDAQNKLSNRIRDINAVRSQELENIYARKDLTPTQVREQVARINELVRFENVFDRAYEDFKNRTKSDKTFNTYWTNIAKNNKSTPFIEWLTNSAATGSEYNSFFSLTQKDENYFADLVMSNKKSTKKE